MYMSVAYCYIHARTDLKSISLYSFIDSLSHYATTSDLQREVTAPDVDPQLSVLLVEGDFTTVFGD
jgi:hypothetical protein